MTDLTYLAIAGISGAIASAALTWRYLALQHRADLARWVKSEGDLAEQVEGLRREINLQGFREGELREKLHILRKRVEGREDWLPRAFLVEWDNKSHKMTGLFIAGDEEGAIGLVHEKEKGYSPIVTIKKIEEIDISEPVRLQSSGWNHHFRG